MVPLIQVLTLQSQWYSSLFTHIKGEYGWYRPGHIPLKVPNIEFDLDVCV